MQTNRWPNFSLIIIAVVLFPYSALGYSAGPLDAHANDPPLYNNCTFCHNTFPVNSGGGAVLMVTAPVVYVSGATIPVDMSVGDPVGMRWGFEMTAVDFAGGSAGNFIIIDPAATQLSDNPLPALDYVKQTSFGTYAGSPFGVAWPILWQAPVSPWPVTFYFAGNAANNDGTSFGDYIYTDSLVVNAASAVYVDLTPTGTTTFPSTGGILDWDIMIESWSGLPADTIDLWVDVKLPNGTIFGPILGPVLDFPMPGFPPPQNISRSRQSTIPAGAPAGNYMMNAYIGDYNPPNNQIRAEDHFGFNKTASDGVSEGDLNGFIDSGEPIEVFTTLSLLSANSAVIGNYPNPFNPSTTLSFLLAEASQIKLGIFDLTGRQVATLVDGYQAAGAHHVVFDATELASGVYVYRLDTSCESITGKMILSK